MPATEHDWVRERLLTDGLIDRSALGWVHSTFISAADEHRRPRPPTHELQQSTIAMIRELVTDGLVILGNLKWRGSVVVGFDAWNLPLDQAMTKIERAYIDNFDDPVNWQTMVWLELTEKGRVLAQQIEDQDMPATEHDWVKQRLLYDGLTDWNNLRWIHSNFIEAAIDYRRPRPPEAELQQSTLALIRELISDGLVILGVPSKAEPRRFDAWNLPLDQAMAKIEHAYIDNFDDPNTWQTMVWVELTDKGRILGQQIADAC